MSILEHISTDLNLSVDFILNVARSSNNRYRHYYIPKKDGSKRSIFQPSPVLKTFQYWLVHNLFVLIPVSAHATAYSRGCSIKKNALAHVNCNHILHMDILNFFGSIKKSHIKSVLTGIIFRETVLTEEDIDFICKICLFKNSLTIGSVSSPIIANCIMYKFDNELRTKLAQDIVYTRYADDLVFSSKEFIPHELVNVVSFILNKYNFKIKRPKTYFMSNKVRKAVTGLTVDCGRISIGLKRRKEIKKMIYKYITYDIGDGNQILGHLFFLKDIEPDYFNMIIKKYSIQELLEVFKTDHTPKENCYNSGESLIEVAATIQNHL